MVVEIFMNKKILLVRKFEFFNVKDDGESVKKTCMVIGIKPDQIENNKKN